MRGNFFNGLDQFAKYNTLHEASDDADKKSDSKYGLEDDPSDNGDDTNPVDNNDNSKYGLGGDPSDNGDDDTNDDNDANPPDDDGVPTDDDNDANPLDDTDGDNDTQPENVDQEIKILNLSDQNKQLNNLRLFRQSRVLMDNVNNTMSTLAKKSFNNDQQVIIDKLNENLSKLKEDLTLVLLVKYSGSYETNMSTYLKYLHRYNVVVNTVRQVYDLTKKDNEELT